MKYQVTGIFDAPYGCEELPETMAELELNGADGTKRKLTVADRVLTEQNIREGDWISVDEAGTVRHASAQETADPARETSNPARETAETRPAEEPAEKAETAGSEIHNFTPYFGRMMEGVKEYVRSEAFPEIHEDSRERIESYIFTMTEYLSWMVFSYSTEGIQWYTRYLYAVKGGNAAERMLERYAGLQQEFTQLMREMYGDSRFETLLRDDQMAMICLVLSIRTAEKLWTQGLTRKEQKDYAARSTLDHMYDAIGTSFRNTSGAYHFDLPGERVMDTALALCHFMIGEFSHEYIQSEYAKIHGIRR